MISLTFFKVFACSFYDYSKIEKFFVLMLIKILLLTGSRDKLCSEFAVRHNCSKGRVVLKS